MKSIVKIGLTCILGLSLGVAFHAYTAIESEQLHRDEMTELVRLTSSYSCVMAIAHVIRPYAKTDDDFFNYMQNVTLPYCHARATEDSENFKQAINSNK